MLSALAERRPVFHSEADFQHAFARILWEKDPRVHSRLDVRQPGPSREHLDLLCIGPESRTAVEFTYVTRQWAGSVGDPPETYELKSHAATDLARRNVVFDIARLERLRGAKQNGVAIVLTNDEPLWTAPCEGRTPTRDNDFRTHDGRILTGALQ